LWVKGEIFRNLDEAAASARGELDREAQHSLFDRIEWFRRTDKLASPRGTPLIVRARAEGSDCWLFLSQSNGNARALASWYTLIFAPVFTGEPNAATKFALLVAAARRLGKRLSSIKLAPLCADDAALVCRAFDRSRWVAQSRESTVKWTISTADMSFEEYWAGRPGELRSTVKRKAAKYSIDTRVFTTFDGNAWADYESIYAASWKTEEGAPEFLRDMALTESAAGTLRMGIASIAGEPVAAQLWTVENGHAIIHKLAHLESAKEQSPGSVLTAAMFEHVIDRDRASLIDFGTGDDRYKADWMDTRQPLYTVSLFNPRRPAGLFGAAKASLSALVGR
jgi:CelD/BcsL family acetyltransferase involved in cellulose biosynthesis